MNIQNFETQISEVILERGKGYFKKGAILEIERVADHKWVAEVEGNYGNYEVEIVLDKKQEIIDYSCDCPFEGDVCKHIVAVLLTIRKELKGMGSIKKTEVPEWEVIIKNAPEAKLRDLLLKYARKDKSIRNEIVIALGEVKNEINMEKYRKIISQGVYSAIGNSGYLDYRSLPKALKIVDKLFSEAQKHLANKKYHEAFSILSAVAMECVDNMEYIDDSDGECVGFIEGSLSLIDTILKSNSDKMLNDAIFNWLLEQMKNEEYNNFDMGYELEALFFDYTKKINKLESAYQYINEKIKLANKKDGWSKTYDLKKYLKYKMDLLKEEGKNAEAEEIINNNIHLDDFRKLKIEQAIKNKDFTNAITLLNKGIIQARNENYAGTVKEYKELLLSVYKKTNDTENIKLISKQLLDEDFSIENYRNYKKNFLPNEWESECLKYITKFSQKKSSGSNYSSSSNLALIFIEEKMWDKLFEIVKSSKSIRVIEDNQKYLKENYSGELIILYEKAILKYAENTGRDIYSNIVTYLHNMAKLENGEAQAIRISSELLETYKNRKAMKEVFSKLNWLKNKK